MLRGKRKQLKTRLKRYVFKTIFGSGEASMVLSNRLGLKGIIGGCACIYNNTRSYNVITLVSTLFPLGEKVSRVLIINLLYISL